MIKQHRIDFTHKVHPVIKRLFKVELTDIICFSLHHPELLMFWELMDVGINQAWKVMKNTVNVALWEI